MKPILIFIIILLTLSFYFSRSSEKEAPLSPSASDFEEELMQGEVDMPNRVLPTSISTGNLLQNGDFEQSLVGWGYEAGVFWSDDGGVDKKGALLINAPNIESESRIIYSKSVEQCVAINGTSKFAIEASFRYLDKLPERPSVNRIHLYWYDSADCSSGGQYGTYVEPNLAKHVWQKVNRRDLKPALGANSAQIRIEQRQDGNNDAVVIWDNIYFSETSKGAPVEDYKIGSEVYTKPLGDNYLRNPSFDKDLKYWGPKRSRRLVWRQLDDLSQGGVMAATLPNDRDGSIGTGSFSQCVNIGRDERYELGARVKVDAASTQPGGGRLRATWYEGINCEGRYRAARHHVDVDKAAVDWQELHIDELQPRTGSKSVSIGIVHSIDGNGQHTLLWDDFYFRAY